MFISKLGDRGESSMWSIPRGFRTPYFLLFSATFIYFVWRMNYVRWPVPHHRLSDLAISSAAVSLVVLNLLSFLVVIFMVIFGGYITRKAEEFKARLEGVQPAAIPLAPEEQQEVVTPPPDERDEDEAGDDSNVD